MEKLHVKCLYDDIQIKQVSFNGTSFLSNDKIGRMILNIGEKSLKIFNKFNGTELWFEFAGMAFREPIFCLSEDDTKYTIHGINRRHEMTDGMYFELGKIYENAYIFPFNIATKHLSFELNLYDNSTSTHYGNEIKYVDTRYNDDLYHLRVSRHKNIDTLTTIYIEKESPIKNFDQEIITSMMKLIFICLGSMPECIKISFENEDGTQVNLYPLRNQLFDFKYRAKTNAILKKIDETTINANVLKNFANMEQEYNLVFSLLMATLSENEEDDLRLTDLIQNSESIHKADPKAPKKKNILVKEKLKDVKVNQNDMLSYYICSKEPYDKNTSVIFENDIKNDGCLVDKFVKHRNRYVHPGKAENISTDEFLQKESYDYFEQKIMLCIRVAYLELLNIEITDDDRKTIKDIALRIENKKKTKTKI